VFCSTSSENARDERGSQQRAVRVHPPHFTPRAAQGSSPHPPLRAARQHRPQGQHRACPRTSRRTAAGRMQRTRRPHRRGGVGLAAAMSVLRRQDDHHRGLRTRRPRPRAAMDDGVMTTNRPSSLCMPAEGPDRRRPDRITRAGRSHVAHHLRRPNRPFFKGHIAMRTPIASPSTYAFPSARRIGGTKRNRHIPIDPKPRSTARGAGPDARHPLTEGRHP
jgi:hypothetical protein